MDQTQALHTEGNVSDYFSIEGHLLSTRSADCYKAVDRSRNQSVSLWMLRHPLAIGSAAVKRFLSRMRSLAQISPPLCEMSAYGVDAAGVAFAVFPALDGQPVFSGNLEVAEAERRFTSALRVVERLHNEGILCGDLCGSSFWINRNGDLRFIGVMGSFDSEAAATAMLPPVETLPFFAPEQRAGTGVELSTDVFAMGVLGYYLFTRKYPYGDGQQALIAQVNSSNLQKISELCSPPPIWADQVLMSCLEASPDRRPPDCATVSQMINEVRARALSQQSSPLRLKKEAASLDGLILHQPKAELPTETEADVATQVSSRMGRPLLLSLLATIAVFSVLLSYRENRSKPEQTAQGNALKSHVAALGNEELKKAVVEINKVSSAAEIEQKSDQIEKIVNSDDPLAHDILVRSAKEAASPEARQIAEKAIVERARRLGLLRSAEQVKQWLRGIKQGELPPAYEPVLKSLDTTLPIEARSSALRQAYATQPQMVLRLAAAIAIDSGNLAEYQPVVAQLVGDNLKLEGSDKLSTIALILIDPSLAMVFGEDVIQKREELPDADIAPVLRALAQRNDINIRSIASLAVQRNTLPPIRAQFLQLIRDRSDLPPDVIGSLLRASAGAVVVQDVASFGRWYDLEAERVLLAILADSDDPEVLKEAFDILTARTLSIKQSASLVNWVRKYYWEKRADFAKSVGILGNLDKVSTQAIDQMFTALDRFVRDSDLIDLLLSSDNQYVVKSVINRYPDLLSVSSLLVLLDNSDKTIRIEAIKALKSFNDLGALKIIIDHYDKEQDQEVRQVYKDTFWMIKERQD